MRLQINLHACALAVSVTIPMYSNNYKYTFEKTSLNVPSFLVRAFPNQSISSRRRSVILASYVAGMAGNCPLFLYLDL